ncbi:MAG TPA: SGNH/GDSL hydrolase family protein [Bryobacteraceae bacterium]|nr:SGNH/GDSL hydrolase family protein [Bryobacteraceae bacterium]
MRTILTIILGGLLLATVAQAQLADEFNVPPANCCLWNTARSLADQLQDWNQLGRYHQANQELKKSPAAPGRVVFMGDSITDGWRLDEYFPGQPYVNRGISGQTTPQMLVRMYPDVIDLKPAAMVLLAGTNDIARNTGPSTAEMIQRNIMAITDLAQHNGIKVLLCSILPVSDYAFLAQQRPGGSPPAARGVPGRGPMMRMQMTLTRPPADILKLNAWMKEYAVRVNAVYVDYFSAFVDEKGWLREGLANDGLHPNSEGYKIMAPLVSAAIQKALR